MLATNCQVVVAKKEMAFSSSAQSSALCFLLLLVSVQLHSSTGGTAQAARLLPSAKQDRYVQVLESLGMVCQCCDGAAGECRSSWESPCEKLECHPPKF